MASINESWPWPFSSEPCPRHIPLVEQLFIYKTKKTLCNSYLVSPTLLEGRAGAVPALQIPQIPPRSHRHGHLALLGPLRVVQAVDGNVGLAENEHVVVEPPAENCAANQVPEGDGDNPLIYVETDGHARGAEPDAERDEEEVGGDVVEAEHDENKDGHVHGHDLGRNVLGLHAHEDGQAHEPVAADAADEDLAPGWVELLVRDKLDDLAAEGFVVKDAGGWETSVPRQGEHTEQRTDDEDGEGKNTPGKVAPEAQEPMQEHLGDG